MVNSNGLTVSAAARPFCPKWSWAHFLAASSDEKRIRKINLSPFLETPAIVGDLICRVPALAHPMLASPVAFIGSTELVPLLTNVAARLTVDDIIRQWALRLELRDCIRIMQWLWQMGIVVPATLAGES